jgi:hypothetical protein
MKQRAHRIGPAGAVSRLAQERATACADPHDGAEHADLQGADVTAAMQEHLKPTEQPGLTVEMVVLIRRCPSDS